MKIKRLLGCLLALVIVLGSVNVGFAEDTAETVVTDISAEDLKLLYGGNSIEDGDSICDGITAINPTTASAWELKTSSYTITNGTTGEVLSTSTEYQIGKGNKSIDSTLSVGDSIGDDAVIEKALQIEADGPCTLTVYTGLGSGGISEVPVFLIDTATNTVAAVSTIERPDVSKGQFTIYDIEIPTAGTYAYLQPGGQSSLNFARIVLTQTVSTSNYSISTADELIAFAAAVNAGEIYANAVLTNDIVLNEGDIAECEGVNMGAWSNWTPIGSSTYRYAGTFDGQGHTISGLFFYNVSEDYAGLFGYTSKIAKISNAAIENSYINGNDYVGGICGYNKGSISDCFSASTLVCESNYIGGICGYNSGSISNCFSTSALLNESNYIGGINGYNNGTISNCFYLTGTAEGGINGSDADGSAEAKTAAEFADGSVAWLLNNASVENVVWYQNIDNGKADSYPTFDSTHGIVYANVGGCPDEPVYSGYTNTAIEIIEITSHTYENSICIYCGGYEEPEILDGVYQISNKGELYWFAEYVNNGNTSANAVLTADITVNEGDVAECEGVKTDSWLDWTPIGSNTYRYTGTFDGQGYIISGLYYNDTSAYYAGLFGYANRASISNISVENSYIKGYYGAGGICGYAYSSTITNCRNTGNIYASTYYVGGICGYSNSSIMTNCINLGTVSGSYYVGGICGYDYNSSSTITSCISMGEISESEYLGGICGSSGGTIKNCYYLEDTAEGGINGSDAEGSAESKTSEEFKNGAVTWLLNGETYENPTWYQNIDNSEDLDSYPVLDSSHGIVYASLGGCPDNIFYAEYSNTIIESAEVTSHTYIDGVCIYCGKNEGPETADGYYQITDLNDLYWFVEYVNDGNTTANAVLTADIVVNTGDVSSCSGENSGDWTEWVPIGNSTYNQYAGIFDGQGHTISGIYYNDTTANVTGLFEYISNAEVKNLGIVNSYISGKNYVGGICGLSYSSSISNCYSTSTIIGSSKYVGGICGYLNGGTITDCHSTGAVSGNSYIGGICGRLYNSGVITNCYYLEGSAAGGIDSTDVLGSAESKTSAEFTDGTVTWLLNGETSDGVWYQSIGSDEYPVLDDTHGTVHIVVDDGSYTNNDIAISDVSGNGEITSLDAALVLKYISGIDVSLNLDAADANNDGEINISDAVKILDSITE